MRWVGWTLVALATLAGCASPRPTSEVAPAAPVHEPSNVLSSDVGAAYVRPGLGMVGTTNGMSSLTHGYSCTAGFLVRSLRNQTAYVATAGHCVEGLEVGDQVTLGFDGTTALAFGHVAYVSELADPSVDPSSCDATYPDEARCFDDLAFVRLDAAAYAVANSSLPTWGGPVAGIGSAGMGTLAYTVGASAFRGGTGLPDARSGAIVESGAWRIAVQFSTTTPPGDSGSPVLDAQGHALGLVIARVPGTPDPVLGVTYVALLQPMLAVASGAGWPVEVVPGGAFTGLAVA